jgi:hypothetical protein
MKKPLKGEKAWNEQQMQYMHDMQQPQPMPDDAKSFSVNTSEKHTLPASLLAQYSALATITWSKSHKEMLV